MESKLRRLPFPSPGSQDCPPEGAIILCGEDGTMVPSNIWDDLIDREECPNLRLVEITHRENMPAVRPRENVWLRDTIRMECMDWWKFLSPSACEVCRGSCTCAEFRTFGEYIENVDLISRGVLEVGRRKTFRTIVVYHNEEWADTHMEWLRENAVRLKVYQYLGKNNIVRRYDLEPESVKK